MKRCNEPASWYHPKSGFRLCSTCYWTSFREKDAAAIAGLRLQCAPALGPCDRPLAELRMPPVTPAAEGRDERP